MHIRLSVASLTRRAPRPAKPNAGRSYGELRPSVPRWAFTPDSGGSFVRKLPLRNMALRGSPQRKVLIGTVAVALTAATIAFIPPALAQVASAVPTASEPVIPSDSLPNPVGDKAAADARGSRRRRTQRQVDARRTINGSTVVKLGKSR